MSSDAEARLAGDSFDGETFEKLDLNGANLSRKELVQCTFKGCKMQDVVWLSTRFEDCVFEQCDLSNFLPKGTVLNGVKFEGCKLVGAIWTEVSDGPAVSFADCNMRYQSFVRMSIQATAFVRCAITESTFSEVNLSRSKLASCDLDKTQFDRCELLKTDFATSTGVYFDPARNRAKGAKISTQTAALIATALGMIVTPD